MKKRLLFRGQSSGRVDDNEETIKQRLKTFHDVTEPVIEYYQKQNKLRRIESPDNVSPDEIFVKVSAHLGDLGKILNKSVSF